MGSLRRRSVGRARRIAIGGLALGAGLLAVPAVAGAAPPSLRLFSSQQRVSASQAELRAGVVDLGVWVTPVGGAFQIDVRRPGYGRWTAAQVDAASGATLRHVPIQLVAVGQGLTGFFSVRFVDSRGHTAARRLITFCPSGESARVNDSGPQNQTYPGDCGAALSFPFVRGMVWGIDPGWAVEASLSPFGAGVFSGSFFPSPGPGPGAGPIPPGVLQHLAPGGINLKPGRYTATSSTTATYRRLFAIAASQAGAALKFRVTPSPPPRKPPPTGVIRSAVAAPALRAAEAIRRALDPLAPLAPGELIPNLVATPAWGIGVHRSGRRQLLTFSATIWDAGPAPLTIEGFRRPHSDIMNAYEYLFDAAGNVVGRAPAGTMFYDNGHGHHHWHLKQLASYTLLGPGGQVVLSQKQSFCIAPTNAVDLTVPDADRSPNAFFGLGFGASTCDLYSPGAIWIREQLPVGWGDTYNQSVAGQAFDITGLPNGRYRIEVRVNPLHVLTETTAADDLAVRDIRLSGHGRGRKVTVYPWHGIRG